MSNANELKSSLRKKALARRDALDVAQRIELSLQAMEHGLAAPEFNAGVFSVGTIVSGFLPIRSEIDTRPFMAELARRGAHLCLPVVISRTEIEFRELVRGAPMEESGFGTIGPEKGSKVLIPQVMVLPLSAFDREGGRIGYGGGYYDRAIEKLAAVDQRPRLIGMAYSIQQVDAVPMEAHDQFLDAIITEKGYLGVNR
ncbi:MAG: 5-formyltetrahydrofolate cyclo-ligase [Rhizobiaceae bacterium]